MSLRIRGKETIVRFAIDGVAKTDGSWVKLKDFRITPRTELVETDYLGESETDLDSIHNGFDFSFNMDHEDAAALEFLRDLCDRSAAGQRPQQVTMTVIYNYRQRATVKAQTFQDVFLKVDDVNLGGRTEVVSTAFSGKCKKHVLVNAG